MKDLLSIKDKTELNQEIAKMHPHDIITQLNNLSEEEQKEFYNKLDSEEVARIISYLEPEDAAEIINEYEISEQSDIIDEMEIDDAADILIHLDNQQDIIDTLEEKEDIEKVLKYEEDDTGAYMSNSYIELELDMGVKEATKKVIKEAGEISNINHLFVTKDKKYVGAVELKKLIKAKDPATINDLISQYPFVIDKDNITKTVYKIKDYGIYEIPVLNTDQELIGVITLDDAINFYHEETTEDFEKLAALPDTDTKGFIKSAISRLPWLFLLLILSVPIALATTRFEHVIASVAVLALFQPLILDAGGDVATQTLAVTLRILNKDKKKAVDNGLKEIVTGVITGLLLGVIASVVSYFLSLQMQITDPLNVSLVVGLSLTLTVISGPIFGFLIPILLDKIKIDPAIASGPFITTLIDVTSVFIYFGLASLVLGVL